MKRRWVVIIGFAVALLTGCVTDNPDKERYTLQRQEYTVTSGQISNASEIVRVPNAYKKYNNFREMAQAADLVVAGQFTDAPVQNVTYAYNEWLDQTVFYSGYSKCTFRIDLVYKGRISEGETITIAQDSVYLKESDRVITSSGRLPMKKDDRWLYFLVYDDEVKAYRAAGDTLGRYPEKYAYWYSAEELGVYYKADINKTIYSDLRLYMDEREHLFEPVKMDELSARNGYVPEGFETEGVLPAAVTEMTHTDSFDGSTYHVDALGVNLTIPKGWYIYCIKGEYVNPGTLEHVRLDFVNEYILTDEPVGEEQLIKDLREPVRARSFVLDDYSISPSYVKFSFRVFRKEYLPIENLFLSVADSDCEYYTFKNYYCGLGLGKVFYAGYMSEPVTEWVRAITGAAQDGLNTSRMLYGPADVEGCNLLIDGNESPFMYGYGSYMCKVDEIAMDSDMGDNWVNRDGIICKRCGNPEYSVIDEDWWNYYSYALTQLNSFPQKFNYPYVGLPCELSVGYPVEEQTNMYAIERELVETDKRLRSGWVYNSQNDSELRAFIYANRRKAGYEDPLSSIMIITNQVDDVCFYGVLILNEELPYGYTVIQWGRDMITGAKLNYAREYATEYIFTGAPRITERSTIFYSIRERLNLDEFRGTVTASFVKMKRSATENG